MEMREGDGRRRWEREMRGEGGGGGMRKRREKRSEVGVRM
jgi:hypothetical protein